MALQHDSEGFLTGEVIADIRRASDALNRIRLDVAAIKRAIMGTTGRRPQGESSPSSARPAATPRQRDGSGRFASSPAEINNDSVREPTNSASQARQRTTAAEESLRDNRGRFTSNGEDGGETQSSKAGISGALNRLTSAVVDTSSNLENVDPTIKAFNEVATPLSMGYQAVFGGDGEDKWYRRIFSELKLFRKEESVFNRAANRSLHNLEEDQGGGGSGNQGSHSFIGGLLGSIATPILAVLSGLGGMLLSGITSVLGVVFGPIGIAIGGAAFAAWGLFTEDGKKFFADVADKLYMLWYDSTEFIKEKWDAAWDPVSDYIKTKWDDAVKIFTDIWEPIAKFFSDKFGIVSDKVTESANKVNDFVKDKTGVDVKKTVKSGYESAVSTVKSGYKSASDAVKSTKNWFLGKTSKMFESGKGGAGTVSTGKGDFGGASYGTYQLSSKQGTLQEFLKSTKYGSLFQGLKPGSKEFNDRWKQVSKMDVDFGTAQHDFVKETHFDPQMDNLKKSGIDLSERGASVQDAVWSTSVQFGKNTSLIKKALAGQDVNKLTDEDIVKAIQDYKISNNDSLFKSSSAKVREGTLNRAALEKQKLLSLASVTPAQPSSIPVPVAISAPKASEIAPPPQVVEPMTSDSGRGLTIALSKGDVGQDVADRKLAHIITGGIASV